MDEELDSIGLRPLCSMLALRQSSQVPFVENPKEAIDWCGSLPAGQMQTRMQRREKTISAPMSLEYEGFHLQTVNPLQHASRVVMHCFSCIQMLGGLRLVMEQMSGLVSAHWNSKLLFVAGYKFC